MSEEFKSQVRAHAFKYAVKNAFEHSGKAELGAVIGKVMALEKDKQEQVRLLVDVIKEAVNEVNSLSASDLESKFKEFEKEGWELKPAERREGLPELDIVPPIITRIAPNPNGVMHLGHAKQAIVNYEYVKKYGGKFILRFDDTDPKIKVSIPNAEKLYLRDLKWLGIDKVDKVVFASSRLERYYEIMRELVMKNKAYVCLCKREDLSKFRIQGKPCPHRSLSTEENLANLEKMKDWKFKEGEAVLLLKTDLKNKDPSMREPPLARIVDKVAHPNKKLHKNHLWPLYNLASAVDDYDFNVNLIIRAQEHAQNAEKQKFIYEALNWKYPYAIHTGRMSLEGFELSKSRIMKGIKEGIYSGYDDPRVATIESLRRRGFLAEAIKEEIIKQGLGTNDAVLAFDNLVATNKKYLDPLAKRFAFIEDPISVSITGLKKKLKIIVSKKRLKELDGKKARLREFENVYVKGNKLIYAGKEIDEEVKHNIIAWIKKPLKIEVLMPDNKKKKGTTEALAKKSEFVHFEGLGYAKREKDKLFVFGHE